MSQASSPKLVLDLVVSRLAGDDGHLKFRKAEPFLAAFYPYSMIALRDFLFLSLLSLLQFFLVLIPRDN